MKLVVIQEHIKRKMLSYKQAISKHKERKDYKNKLIDELKEYVTMIQWRNSTERIRWSRAEKLLKVIDQIVYDASDRGFCFWGRETLAERCNCNVHTVDKAIKVIKTSNMFAVAYGENTKANGVKTLFFFIKDHVYYSYWSNLLQLETKVNTITENPETPCAAKEKNEEEERTNLTLSSEIDTYLKDNKEKNDKSFLKEIKKGSKENKEENANAFFDLIESMNLTEDQKTAKSYISTCPFINENIRKNARKISMKLPETFTELDWGVLGGLMRNLQGRTPLKPVEYVLKSFYKNKIYEAEIKGISLENQTLREDLLPQKYKDSKLLKNYQDKLIEAEKTGDHALISACKTQLQIMAKRMQKNKCHILDKTPKNIIV